MLHEICIQHKYLFTPHWDNYRLLVGLVESMGWIVSDT